MTELLDVPTGADAATARRRRRRWLIAAALAAAVVFVLYWFQPQKLFTDDEVDEAIPMATTEPTDVAQPPAGAATAPPTTAAPAEPVELARGEFVSRDHGTRGSARVLELADGRRIVRLEDLDTSNGPDLYVYLSPSTAAGEESAFDDDHVDLGRLKGNQGDQNYDLPADLDLARFASVVIWCDRFDSAFGAADLTAT